MTYPPVNFQVLATGAPVSPELLDQNFQAAAAVDGSNVAASQGSGTTTPYAGLQVYDRVDTGYFTNETRGVTLPQHVSFAAAGFHRSVVDVGGQPHSGPNTAGYTAIFSNYRQGWPNSGTQGEMDGLLISVSNDVGDINGISFNIKTVLGAVACYEGGVSYYNTASENLGGVDVQSGIVNAPGSNAGPSLGVFGFAVSLNPGSWAGAPAFVGTAAFAANAAGSASWTNYLEFSDNNLLFAMTEAGQLQWNQRSGGVSTGGGMTLSFRPGLGDNANQPGLIIGNQSSDILQIKNGGESLFFGDIRANSGIFISEVTIATLPSASTSGGRYAFCVDVHTINANASFLVECDGGSWYSVGGHYLIRNG